MLRGWKPLLALAGIACVAGCSAPSNPQVTFYSHGESQAASPTLYCDDSGEQCDQPGQQAITDLQVPPDAPLQISVPKEVSEAPWQVAFIYRNGQGDEVEQRTSVFAPGTRHAYTLHPPDDSVQLEHVEVQRFSAVLTAGPQGGVNFGIGGSWILNTN